MKKFWLFLVFSLLGISMFTSCKDDEKDPAVPVETTVAEDKANINASIGQLEVNFESFKTGVSFKEVDSFIYKVNNEALTEEWLDSMMTEIDDVIDLSLIDANSRFTYGSYKGKYIWSNSSNEWTKEANANIIVSFPSNRILVVNDCELGILSYTDSPYTIDAEQIYLPTAASMYLTKDNVKLLGLDMSASFNAQGFPEAANLEVYAKPITMSAALTKNTDSKYTITGSLVEESNPSNSFSVSAAVTFENDITAYTDMDDAIVNNVQLSLSQGALSIAGSIDVKTLDALDGGLTEPTVTEINACLNLAVLYNEANIGTIKVVEVAGEKEVFIVYKDQTQENTSIFYESLVNSVESLMK